MSTIHIADPEGEQSQHDETQLQLMEEQGLIRAGTRYWMAGMPEWRPITEYFKREPPTPTAGRYRFTKDPRILTNVLLVLLWFCLAVEVAALFSNLGQWILVSKTYTHEAATINDVRQQIIAITYLVAFVTTAIVFMMWTYRANLNSRGFGARKMEFTPGWSVGWFFIPFANLVMPFRVMREIWQVSQDPVNWRSFKPTPLLGWWWGLWILNNICANISNQYGKLADTPEKLVTSTGIAMISNVVGIAVTLVVINLLQEIVRSQVKLVAVEESAEGLTLAGDPH